MVISELLLETQIPSNLNELCDPICLNPKTQNIEYISIATFKGEINYNLYLHII